MVMQWWLVVKPGKKNQYDYLGLILVFVIINLELFERYYVGSNLHEASNLHSNFNEAAMSYCSMGISIFMLLIVCIVSKPIYRNIAADNFFEFGADRLVKDCNKHANICKSILRFDLIVVMDALIYFTFITITADLNTPQKSYLVFIMLFVVGVLSAVLYNLGWHLIDYENHMENTNLTRYFRIYYSARICITLFYLYFASCFAAGVTLEWVSFATVFPDYDSNIIYRVERIDIMSVVLLDILIFMILLWRMEVAFGYIRMY